MSKTPSTLLIRLAGLAAVIAAGVWAVGDDPRFRRVPDHQVAGLYGGDPVTCYARHAFNCNGGDEDCESIDGYRVYLDEPDTKGYKDPDTTKRIYCHHSDWVTACSFTYKDTDLEKCDTSLTVVIDPAGPPVTAP